MLSPSMLGNQAWLDQTSSSTSWAIDCVLHVAILSHLPSKEPGMIEMGTFGNRSSLAHTRARLQSMPSARRARAFLAGFRARLPPTANMYRRLQGAAARGGRARGLRPRDMEDIDGLYAREMDDELDARSFDDLEELYIRSLYDAIDDLEARSLYEFEELEARELEYGLDELD